MSASPALDHIEAGPHGHHYTTTGLDSRKIAVWAFIGSECMLFASLISTYLIYKGRSVVGPFPHEACNPPACAVPLKPILHIPVSTGARRGRTPRQRVRFPSNRS